MWKCHECGHKFNFQKLKIQRCLNSKVSAAFLTILFMIYLMFVLGFVADPIINIYMDPYESLMGYESIWDELEVRSAKQSALSAWTQHFAKGFISMGLVGFLKTLLLNPFHWINLRWGSGLSSRASTGRDRAVNISWIALVIGICSAFVFFYKWVQAIMQRLLVRLGNNIVDTHLPGDDDDLKPPPGENNQAAPTVHTEPDPKSRPETRDLQQDKPTSTASVGVVQELTPGSGGEVISGENSSEESPQISTPPSTQAMQESWISVDGATDRDEHHLLSGIHRQGWSFSNL